MFFKLLIYIAKLFLEKISIGFLFPLLEKIKS